MLEKLESMEISIRREVVKKYSMEFYVIMKNSEGEKYVLTRKGDQNISFKNKSAVHIVGCNFNKKQERLYLQMHKNGRLHKQPLHSGYLWGRAVRWMGKVLGRILLFFL